MSGETQPHLPQPLTQGLGQRDVLCSEEQSSSSSLSGKRWIFGKGWNLSLLSCKIESTFSHQPCSIMDYREQGNSLIAEELLFSALFWYTALVEWSPSIYVVHVYCLLCTVTNKLQCFTQGCGFLYLATCRWMYWTHKTAILTWWKRLWCWEKVPPKVSLQKPGGGC